MAVKIGLWSLTLLPGQPTPLYIRRDFTITNAALGEELRSTDGRSVVKVTHTPIPPEAFDSDSEIDSDEEIDDEEASEDEFELDQEEGFKLTPKKAAAKAAAAGQSAEEDEEEDEEDDLEGLDDEDDDSDFSDDELRETTVLCSLTAGRIEQSSLDVTFVEGDVVVFETTGENAVHLTGNYILQPQPHDHDDEDDDEYDSEDFDDEHDDYDIYGSDLEEEDDVSAGNITELAETSAVPLKVTESKKRKAEAVESPTSKASVNADTSIDGLSKNQKKKLAKKLKTEETAVAPVVASSEEKKADKKAEAKPTEKKRTLASGLIIEDVKVGEGAGAKAGKRLGMRYIGKLENGKQFDANTGGKPFSFVLGRGEVIKGWDQGLLGMAVGGERRLTIPATLAYGSQKLPGIPKNSTLKFDVKLVSIN